jgi:exonuclease SbcC
MRLHALRVTAFGPFAGTEEVDFDALGADGLFLLHGPTGAGKTTVLDAVAFALFGKLPGARQDVDGRRLLSDHAPDGATPRVELELSVGGRRLRLDRSPEHLRAKKRGGGTTTENARASLVWLDDPGREGVTRIDEVAREVERLLGMSADQFFQVVLLPQGEFARFLRSGTDERAVLLARLFDTARFGGAEAWLAERRRRSSAAVEEGSHEVDVLLGRLGTAAGVEEVAAADGEVTAWAESLLGMAAAEQDRSEAEVARAQLLAGTATGALDVARVRAQQVLRRDEALGQLANLAEHSVEREATAVSLRAAGRAAGVAAAARDAATAQVSADRAEHEASVLAAALGDDPDGAEVLERTGGREPESPWLFDVGGEGAPSTLFDLPPGPDLEAACAGWRAEVGRLAELVDLAGATTADEAHVLELEARSTALRGRLAQVEERRRELPVEREVAESALSRAQRAQDALGELEQAWDRARAAAAAAERVLPLERADAEAERAHTVAVAGHQASREHWLDLRERRLLGMAAELAGNLDDGQACVVCGSHTHPRPARPAVDVVRQEDEQRAHEQEQAGAQAVHAAAERRTQSLRELDAARAQGGGLDLLEARRVLAAADGARSTALRLAATLPVAQERSRALELAADGLAQQELVDGKELAAVAAEVRALVERAAAARERLALARGSDPDVGARLARLDGLAVTGAKLVSARAAADQSRGVARERAVRALRMAEEEGFSGVPQAVAAVLEPARAAELQQGLDRAREAEVRARAVLEGPDVRALGELDAAAVRDELAAAQVVATEAELARGAAQGAAATARQRHGQVGEVAGRLRERLAVLAPLLAEAARVAALADVVAGRGQNSRKVSLHSYVLAARLEEVAVAASARLARMSGGRYEFVHSDAAGSHGRRGGLGLDVLDDHTGVVRSTKTLSGGESFVASLSLALGLADVVAAEAGGVQLDTLFIDEGFGTLDPSTLEEVMAVLDELRAGGRVVGLVSHVDELRQRIPNRLHVRSTRTGSRLEASTSG